MADVAHHGDAAIGPTVDRRPVKHRPDKGLVHRVDNALDLRMPAGISRAQILNLARLGPGLADPILLLDMADEIQQPSAGNKLMDEVASRPEECGGLRRDITHLLYGN